MSILLRPSGVLALSFTLEFNKFNLVGKISNCKKYHNAKSFNLFGKYSSASLRLWYNVLHDKNRYIIKIKINFFKTSTWSTIDVSLFVDVYFYGVL